MSNPFIRIRGAGVVVAAILTLVASTCGCRAADDAALVSRPAGRSEYRSLPLGEVRAELARQRALRHTDEENPALQRRLGAELARRGDRTERERIYAALKSERLLEQSHAIEDCAGVGDEEAVVQLAALLADPNPGGRISYRTPEGNWERSPTEAVLPPRQVAAMKLAELIPNPVVPPLGAQKKFYTDEDVETWQRWWKKHSATYEARAARIAATASP